MQVLRVIGICFLLAGTGQGAAPVPSQVNYQGRLLDSLGEPVNGAVVIELNLYTNVSAGAAVYSESIGSVIVQNGVYQLLPHPTSSTWTRPGTRRAGHGAWS